MSIRLPAFLQTHHLFQPRVLEARVKAYWSYWKDSHESLPLWLIRSLYNAQNVRLTNCAVQTWQLKPKQNTEQQSALSHQPMPGFGLPKPSQLQPCVAGVHERRIKLGTAAFYREDFRRQGNSLRARGTSSASWVILPSVGMMCLKGKTWVTVPE